ncbi:MAG: hypothetical protein ACXWNG_05180, partial [Candidatus Limnocylindrales bacterium]
ALFYITLTVVAIANAAARGEVARYILVVAPTNAVEGLTAWLFNTEPGRPLSEAAIGGEVYALAALIMAVVGVVVLARRYTRIAA